MVGLVFRAENDFLGVGYRVGVLPKVKNIHQQGMHVRHTAGQVDNDHQNQAKDVRQPRAKDVRPWGEVRAETVANYHSALAENVRQSGENAPQVENVHQYDMVWDRCQAADYHPAHLAVPRVEDVRPGIVAMGTT